MAQVNDDQQQPNRWLMEYSEVNNNIRELTSIRFQLLAFLPAGTILGAFLLADADTVFHPVLALFGMVITLGLWIYHLRNDQLYGALIGRAKELESRLLLINGQYRQRPAPWLNLEPIPLVGSLTIDHSTGINLVYGASFVAWFYAIVYGLLAWMSDGPIAALIGFSVHDRFESWESVEPVVIATVALALAGFSYRLIARWFARLSKERNQQLRDDARQAIEIMSQLQLSTGEHYEEDWEKAYTFLAHAKHGQRQLEETELDKLRKRCAYYHRNPDEIAGKEVDRDSEMGVEIACQLAALLTDLPARWYYDLASGRRA